MFNWSRQQAEALYYDWCVLIYGLVADVAVMFRGTEMFKPANVCVCTVVMSYL